MGQHADACAALGQPGGGHESGHAGAHHHRVVVQRASHRARCAHVEHPLEDPVVQPGLAHLVAVEDRPRPLPALLEEGDQRFVGLLGGHAVEAVEQAGGAVGAEAALAGPHAQAQDAPDVVEVGCPPPLHRRLELAARNQLALADQLVVQQRRLAPGQALGEVVVLASLRARQRSAGRGAGALLAELPADSVHGLLRHQPEGRELAAGDRDEAAHPVALGVVEERVRAGDVAGGGDVLLGVLEQRADTRPDPHRPGPAETGDELLAVLEHRVDLVLGHGLVVGIGGLDVGGPDHADRADRDQDVAVGGHLAAVDHRVHQPVVHRDHDSPARVDVDALDPGQVGDTAGPGARGVHGHARPDVHLVAAANVAQLRARHLVAVALDGHRGVVGHDPAPRRAGARRGPAPRRSSRRRCRRRAPGRRA